MAATGYTPISLYYSTTGAAVPVNTNLVNGELAINITDGKLYYKDNAGVVQLLAGKGGTGIVAGSNTQIQYNNSGTFGASANLTFNGTTLTASQIASSGLTATGMVFAGTGGLLTTAAGFTYTTGTSTLTVPTAIFSGTGAVTLPVGTTAQEPGTPTVGMIRYNTTTNSFEGYAGSSPAWGAIGGGGSGASPVTTDFTATGGQTVFTVAYPVGNLEVYRNGIKLGIADFTATNGTSFTLATGAIAGDLIEAVSFSGASGAAGVSSFSGGTTGFTPAGTGTGVVTLAGTLVAANGGTGLTSPGTSGNVLTSNGTAWVSSAPAGGGGKSADVQTFTTSGTWTKPTGFGAKARVYIQVWGGGGSGGRGSFTAGGGGGGGYNERWIDLSALGATESITIGSGGTAITTNSQGNTGGSSSFGSRISAYGGGGGQSSSSGGNSSGGGGGGQLSSGQASGNAGRPGVSLNQQAAFQSYPEGAGGSPQAGAQLAGVDGFFKGGGGGAQSSACCIATAGAAGATTVYGGSGGGAATTGAGSTTGGAAGLYGGAGGAGSNSSDGTDGTAPSGGGGGTRSGTTSGAGADGRIIVTVFDGV